jgi:hypothetical protein
MGGRAATLFVALAVMAGAAGAQAAGKASGSTTWKVDIGAANASGVSGNAKLTLTGDKLAVEVDVSGLTPGHTHMMHLHGKTGENVTCEMKDTNGDGMVDEKEAEAASGKEVLFLKPFPRADAGGKVHFAHTYTIDPRKVGPIGDRVLEIHGQEKGGKYLDKLPVACGKPATTG